MTETEGCTALIDYARLKGWDDYHTFDSRRSNAGFPDLVLVRERVVYIELKVKKRMPSEDQWWWLYRLHEAGAEVYLVWIDDEFDFIEEVLK